MAPDSRAGRLRVRRPPVAPSSVSSRAAGVRPAIPRWLDLHRRRWERCRPTRASRSLSLGARYHRAEDDRHHEETVQLGANNGTASAGRGLPEHPIVNARLLGVQVDWRALQRCRVPESSLSQGSKVSTRSSSLATRSQVPHCRSRGHPAAQRRSILALVWQRHRRRRPNRPCVSPSRSSPLLHHRPLTVTVTSMSASRYIDVNICSKTEEVDAPGHDRQDPSTSTFGDPG